MSTPLAEDYRSKSKLLFVAALLVDVAAILALVLPVVSGGDVSENVLIALPLFVLASLLLIGAMSLRRKADAAEAGASPEADRPLVNAP